MKRIKCHRVSLGLQITLAATATGLFAVGAGAAPPDPPRYMLTSIETLGGEFSQALGMNEHGTVVGWSTTTENPTDSPHAFLWHDGVVRDLGSLGGMWAEARDVNDDHLVVGVSMTKAPPDRHGLFERHGFLWSDGVMFDLNDIVVGLETLSPPPDLESPEPCTAPLRMVVEANSINKDGSIVGCGLLFGDDNMHGIVLIPSEPFFPTEPLYTWADLGVLKGAPDCFAHCINDAGYIVGMSGRRAYFHDGEIHPMDFRAGESAARSINSHGLVVGWAGENEMMPVACMWEDGHRLDLGGPHGWVSEALDVSDNGLVVGWIAENLGHPALAMLWEGCIPVDLNAVTAIPLTETEPWTLEAAIAVDAAGRIAGVGRMEDGAPRAFLLVPITEALAGAVTH